MESIKSRRARIREAYCALVKETGKKAITTRAIAKKADLSVNGISQSLCAMRNFKLINAEARNGGDWTWEIEDDGA